jgi:TonB-dependent Receptor Plug Domain
VRIFLSLLVLAAGVLPARAQVSTGRLDVSAKDRNGAGVTVTVDIGVAVGLRGIATSSAATDAAGTAHFFNLVPGLYRVSISSPTYTAFEKNDVHVVAGTITVVNATLYQRAEARPTPEPVTAVSHPGAVVVSTVLDASVLARLPTSRDPWSALQMTPAVLLDQLNAGAPTTGRQPVVTTKGASAADNTWTIDGIPVTDMVATGTSPAHYDFDAIDHLQVTTGGAALQSSTTGAQTNLVLKSGTNVMRGRARVYFSTDGLQGDNIGADLTGVVSGYRRMDSVFDAGGDAGGPLVANRLFGWFAYAHTEAQAGVFQYSAAAANYTRLGDNNVGIDDIAAKFTMPSTQSRRIAFSYFRASRTENGAGLSPTRLAETALTTKSPMDLVSGEIARMLKPALFLALRGAYVHHTLTADAAGGNNTVAYRDDAGVWHNTFEFQDHKRPQMNVLAEGTYFWHGQALDFGAGWRHASVEAARGWPGGQFDLHVGYPILFAQVTRDAQTNGHADYLHAFIGDTLRFGALSVNGGVRLDRQAGSVDSASVNANPLAPTRLPAVSVAGASNVIVWTTFAPRVSGALMLSQASNFVLRGTYAEFGSQLPADLAASLEGLPARSIASFSVADRNNNKIFDAADVSAFVGLDVSNTTVGNYSTPRTREATGGIERNLGRGMHVSATYTWRQFNDFNWLHLAGVTGSDFSQGGVVRGSLDPIGAFNVPFYLLNPVALPADLLQVYESRTGYSQIYQGFEVMLERRLAQGWMFRIAGSSGNHVERFATVDATFDPTPSPPAPGTLASPNVDRGDVVRETTGVSATGTYMIEPRYQMSAAIAGHISQFDLGIHYFMRQGYAAPYFRSQVTGSVDATSDTGKNVLLVPDVNEFRLPMTHSIDVRVSRPFRLLNHAWRLDVDLFNVINRATVTALGYDARLTSFDTTQQVVSPFALRIGVRFDFK